RVEVGAVSPCPAVGVDASGVGASAVGGLSAEGLFDVVAPGAGVSEGPMAVPAPPQAVRVTRQTRVRAMRTRPFIGVPPAPVTVPALGPCHARPAPPRFPESFRRSGR